MRQSLSMIFPLSPRIRRTVRAGVKLALCLSVLSGTAATGSALAGTKDSENTPSVDAIMQSAKLRLDARLAAEQGDFLAATEALESAAGLVGDRMTAGKARDAHAGLEAQGGSQFADFSALIQLITEQTAPPARWYDIDGEGGRMSQFSQGVFMGAPALMAALTLASDDSRLNSAFEMAQSANHNQNVHVASNLRLVSLPRLEQYVLELKAAGQSVSDDVACLAGLTEVQYLFVFAETGDVVIGGPAGSWTVDDTGRTVGIAQHRPTLQLDDLVTLSRTFSSGGTGFFMCSIDPKPEQVKAVQELVRTNGTLSPKNVGAFAAQAEDTLGLQNVIVQGIPADSRVASVIVDADYQMKLIGIGKRDGADGMKSYFDLMSRSERRGASMDALRWWMTVGYDAIFVAPNQQAFEFSGRSIRCLAENQIVQQDGSRQATGKAEKANAEFARLFTENLPELANEEMLFADLQNVFDLALVSALVQSQGIGNRVGWHSEAFGVDGSYQPADVNVPHELMTAANFRTYRGGDIVVQVAGGVRGDLKSIVQNPETFEISPEVAKKAAAANPIGQSGRWWWDAAAR
ncbi:MAG: DUF1598 domain-containing protein [Planctomycetaceae bacterium]